MNTDRVIAVIGLGYVGFPLALALSKFYKVIGFDIQQSRIDELSKGIDRLNMINGMDFDASDISFSSNEKCLADADFYIVAVQTPVDNSKKPDPSALLNATKTIAANLNKDDLVVYEATVYPGMTEEECIPVLESHSKLKAGVDFFVGYSPERINPGDTVHTLENTIKIIAAQDEESLEVVKSVYSKVITAGLHEATSIKVAEAAKVIENTQRDINIALMNELALIFNKAGIDTKDVLDAAGTKWNFLKFQPGLVGGHCIGVDPYYLTHKSLLLGYSPRVILSGRSVNDGMGFYVARQLVKHLVRKSKADKNAEIIVFGFAFKENISDVRNTRVIDIVKELQSFELNVQVFDPYVNEKEVEDEYGITVIDESSLKPADAVVLAVAHDMFINDGWGFIKKHLNKNAIVYDIKSTLPREQVPDHVELVRL
jgi:UDP-N-acetyl-D-glucosamine/UDP-N-acetyl-D-galactosamine dehydrogenase